MHVMQGWSKVCRSTDCKSRPAIPDHAYVITLPDDEPKRQLLLPELSNFGLTAEVVNGIKSDQVRHCSLVACPQLQQRQFNTCTCAEYADT